MVVAGVLGVRYRNGGPTRNTTTNTASLPPSDDTSDPWDDAFLVCFRKPHSFRIVAVASTHLIQHSLPYPMQKWSACRRLPLVVVVVVAWFGLGNLVLQPRGCLRALLDEMVVHMRYGSFQTFQRHAYKRDCSSVFQRTTKATSKSGISLSDSQGHLRKEEHLIGSGSSYWSILLHDKFLGLHAVKRELSFLVRSLTENGLDALVRVPPPGCQVRYVPLLLLLW